MQTRSPFAVKGLSKCSCSIFLNSTFKTLLILILLISTNAKDALLVQADQEKGDYSAENNPHQFIENFVTPPDSQLVESRAVPNPPILVQPADGSLGVGIPTTLQVTVSDSDADPMDVSFYGRAVGENTAEDFTLILLPDTQYYSNGSPAYFTTQTNWIVQNRISSNIVFVTHLGDLVHTPGAETEWQKADTAMDLLDEAIEPKLPYSVAPGDHDSSTTYYAKYFGITRFSDKPWYQGYYDTNNKNNYSFFSASGMDFMVINLQYNPDAAMLAWADGLLKANPARRAIVVSHSILNADNTFSNATIYDALKGNPNLFLMLCGHSFTSSPLDGAAWRDETYDGNTVYIRMSNYEVYPNGGDGYLRIMRFSPANDQIFVSTYSPFWSTYLTDDDNQFTIPYDMDGGAPFELIGTVTGVSSGGNASIVWYGLEPETEYEWYVVEHDGTSSNTSLTWSFTTAASGPACYDLTLSHTGSGTTPVADPIQSPTCISTGKYVEGESISLSGAVADNGWTISSWSGTINNSSTLSTNSLIMPASNHTASVIYSQDSYTLSVNKSGSGSGTVTSSPSGIDCGSDCSESFLSGTTITLSANPDIGATFVGWSGACSGLESCQIEMTESLVLIATFNLMELTISGNASVEAAQISLTGGEPVTTNTAGNYSINIPYNWSGTITPSKPGYIFTPAYRSYETLTTDITNQDFEAIPEPDTVSIALVPGWNLISFNLRPVSTAVTDVLASIYGHYDMVYAWNATSGGWLKYDTLDLSPDTLTTLDETMGIWIHMLNAAVLEFTDELPTMTGIPLKTGWNLVGFPSSTPSALPGVLSGIDAAMVYEYQADDLENTWKMYDFAGPAYANDLSLMTPDRGYWILSNGDATWSVGY